MRPVPTWRQACQPVPGPTRRKPSASSWAALRFVDGWFHIASFMAGASRTGVLARSMALRAREITSSVRPVTSLAIMSMVHGAISAASQRSARAMCCGSFASVCCQGLV